MFAQPGEPHLTDFRIRDFWNVEPGSIHVVSLRTRPVSLEDDMFLFGNGILLLGNAMSLMVDGMLLLGNDLLLLGNGTPLFGSYVVCV